MNCSKDKISVYIDIDTAFTVFLENNQNLSYAKYLYIFRPKITNLDDVIAEICSLNPACLDTIVLDSVTSFYSLQGNSTIMNLNRKLGIYVSLLQMAVSRSNGRIIFTSMIRARKKNDDKSWYMFYAGGRLLRKRSDLILELKSKNKDLDISILKSPDVSRTDTKLSLNGKYIEA